MELKHCSPLFRGDVKEHPWVGELSKVPYLEEMTFYQGEGKHDQKAGQPESSLSPNEPLQERVLSQEKVFAYMRRESSHKQSDQEFQKQSSEAKEGE